MIPSSLEKLDVSGASRQLEYYNGYCHIWKELEDIRHDLCLLLDQDTDVAFDMCFDVAKALEYVELQIGDFEGGEYGSEKVLRAYMNGLSELFCDLSSQTAYNSFKTLEKAIEAYEHYNFYAYYSHKISTAARELLARIEVVKGDFATRYALQHPDAYLIELRDRVNTRWNDLMKH